MALNTIFSVVFFLLFLLSEGISHEEGKVTGAGTEKARSARETERERHRDRGESE